MTKRRVYEIAKELGISSKEVIDRLVARGGDVKNHMSVVPDELIDDVIAELKRDKMQEAFQESASAPEEVEKRRLEDEAKKRSEVEAERVAQQKAIDLKTIFVPPMTTIKELTELFKVSRNEVVKQCMKLGILNVAQKVDIDVATLIGQELGLIVKLKKEETEREESLDREDAAETLELRPPIVTVMGHVDHGKTTLLDNIRKTNVTAGEAGGITQHIGAYQVSLPSGEKITFLDTPGHEAFTAMRAHGAAITDIAVLVVAADDGVMPQTVEAIDHANAADVPVIVAINKVDKDGANIDKVKSELSDHGLAPEDWGGEVICVPVSAKTGEGIDDLLEMIHIVCEMKELKANPNRQAVGVVVEARKDVGVGPMATVLIQKGTLKVGDAFLCGPTWGRVRQILNESGKRLKKAGPSTPVVIIGFSDTPESGERFYVVDNDKIARQMSEKTKTERRDEVMLAGSRRGARLEDLFKSEIKELKLIVKADVKGSVIAVRDSLEKLSTDDVTVKVIHAQAGAVNENDVMLASASDAVVIAFNLRPSTAVTRLAESENVQIRTYEVIYHIHDDIRKAIKGMLDPVFEEKVLGKAEVRETFKVPKIGVIAGCYVPEGKITRNKSARIVREGVVVYTGKVDSLRRFKEDVTEVRNGYECGIGIDKFNDIKVGDLIEIFEVVQMDQE